MRIMEGIMAGDTMAMAITAADITTDITAADIIIIAIILIILTTLVTIIHGLMADTIHHIISLIAIRTHIMCIN